MDNNKIMRLIKCWFPNYKNVKPLGLGSFSAIEVYSDKSYKLKAVVDGDYLILSIQEGDKYTEIGMVPY